jgi:hypothetical protein
VTILSFKSAATCTTDALQDRINTACADKQRARTIQLPPGQIPLTRPLVIPESTGFRLIGDGTELVYRGDDTACAIEFQNCRDASLEHLTVSSYERQPDTLLLYHRTSRAPGTVVSTGNRTEGVTLDCGNGSAARGVYIVPTINENNDLFRFTNTSFVNYSLCGAEIQGTQAHAHSFDHCGFSGSFGQNAIRGGGSWHTRRCTGGGHREATFFVTNQTLHISAHADNWEGDLRLLETSGPTGAMQGFTFENVRFEFDRLHTDTSFIKMLSGGPLRIVGGQYGSGDRVGRIEIASYGDVSVTVEGATFAASGTGLLAAFPMKVYCPAGKVEKRIRGNLYADATGRGIARPDWDTVA